MKTFQKRLEKVEAIQITAENTEELLGQDGVQAVGEGVYAVMTPEGKELAHPGEWLNRTPGTTGDFSILPSVIFETIYEEI